MNYRKEFERELPLAPVRHRQVMEKLARCRFCDRLSCCMKHLLEHEGRHLPLEEECQEVRGGKYHSSEQRYNTGWVDATEAVLASSRKKIKFPLFCIYCKITVKNEYDLRCLMTNGPRCPTKESHWIVSFKKYHEKIINSQFFLVLEESAVNTPSVKISDKRLQADQPPSYESRICLNSSQNRNFAGVQSYSITPQSDFTYPQVTPRDSSLYSIRKMKSFSTSTPQDGSAPNNLDIDLSPSPAQTPECGKNVSAPQSILSNVKNDQKPKGDSARKVTFSITKTKEVISNNKCDENEGKKNKTDKNEKDSDKKCEEKDDDGSIIGTKIGEDEENKKELVGTHKECSKQLLDENAQKQNCKNKLDDESIIKAVISGENKECDEFSDNADVLKEIDKIPELIDKCDKGIEKEENKKETEHEIKLEGERVEKMEMHGENEENSKNNDEKIILFSADDKPSLAEKEEDEQNKESDSVKERSNESSSQTFYSGEESEDGRYELESSSFSESSGGDSKESLVSSTETDLRGYPYKTCKDSQRLSSVSDEVSEKPKFRKTLSSSFSYEAKDNSENEPPTELNFEKTQISPKDDNLHYSFEDAEETDKTNSYLHHSESCAAKDLPYNKSEQINVSNTEQEWSFTKIASALSSSWNKAKELVMQSWGTKRENLDSSEDNTNDAPSKRIKLSHSCSCSDHNTCTLPVQWKCSQRPIRTYDYNIKSRRPLPRMGKK